MGAVKVGAGVALGVGFAPRFAAGILAALQVPTMVARHPVWAVPSQDRREHLSGLLRDGAVLGGLLLAAADTAGKPSLAWQLDAARQQVSAEAKKTGRKARRSISDAVERFEALGD